MTTAGVVVAADLDRTLLYSSGALALDPDDREVRRLLCVELYQGLPLSFLTETAASGVAQLNRAGVLVPVTTRTVEQFCRIDLPGPTPRFALCANGGRLLRDGVEDEDFSTSVAARLAGSGAPLGELRAELERASAATRRPFVTKVRDASGLFCYAVVEQEHIPAGWVEDLAAFADERGWTVSVQGRKVYLVPAALTKGAAARHVADLLGAGLLLAAGDSLLDADLLEAADHAIRPAHGELADAGWTRDHVAVTTVAGVRAGEQIVRWMLDRVLDIGAGRLRRRRDGTE